LLHLRHLHAQLWDNNLPVAGASQDLGPVSEFSLGYQDAPRRHTNVVGACTSLATNSLLDAGPGIYQTAPRLLIPSDIAVPPARCCFHCPAGCACIHPAHASLRGLLHCTSRLSLLKLIRTTVFSFQNPDAQPAALTAVIGLQTALAHLQRRCEHSSPVSYVTMCPWWPRW
jgi:hypothetical protein